MKLLIAIVNKDDTNKVSDGLMDAGFIITKLATTGGFLRSGNTTMIMGVSDEKLDEALNIIKSNSQKRTVDMAITNPAFVSEIFIQQTTQITVGGATVFVLDVDKFYKL
ncbi:MAG: cyclic-di-AMP receptor [Oscillospiraceae bacterium]